MNKILAKANEIITEAKTNNDFFSTYAENIIGTGERSADYTLFEIELGNDYSVLIDFVDFQFKTFSVIHKDHKSTIWQIENLTK